LDQAPCVTQLDANTLAGTSGVGLKENTWKASPVSACPIDLTSLGQKKPGCHCLGPVPDCTEFTLESMGDEVLRCRHTA